MTRLLLTLVVLTSMVACSRNDPLLRAEAPRVVTKVVERTRPYPLWATEELPKPMPADGTVRARGESHDARGAVIDLANCHRRLMRLENAGETVDPKECERP